MLNNNIILIDKPKGITSNDVVQQIKKYKKYKKVGHAGTLDPNATGLLVIGINNGTKKLGNLTLDNKQYIATIHFGKQTDTFDSEGKIIKEIDTKNLTLDKIINSINLLMKEYLQSVPMFSAVKIKGEKLYNLARKNISIDTPKKEVKILNYEIINFSNPILILKIDVSKGFYVRSFANDVGILCDNCAFLEELRRTKSGEFNVCDALKFQEFISNV
jgi:tRNA pseudouridine55 synthase